MIIVSSVKDFIIPTTQHIKELCTFQDKLLCDLPAPLAIENGSGSWNKSGYPVVDGVPGLEDKAPEARVKPGVAEEDGINHLVDQVSVGEVAHIRFLVPEKLAVPNNIANKRKTVLRNNSTRFIISNGEVRHYIRI